MSKNLFTPYKIILFLWSRNSFNNENKIILLTKIIIYINFVLGAVSDSTFTFFINKLWVDKTRFTNINANNILSFKAKPILAIA